MGCGFEDYRADLHVVKGLLERVHHTTTDDQGVDLYMRSINCSRWGTTAYLVQHVLDKKNLI